MAAVLNLPALAEAHKAVAGTPCAVAGSAEARNIAKFHQPANNFIQCTVIAYIKLGRIIFLFRFGIAANAGAGTDADLRNAEVQHPFAGALAFTGRYYLAWLRHA